MMFFAIGPFTIFLLNFCSIFNICEYENKPSDSETDYEVHVTEYEHRLQMKDWKRTMELEENAEEV